MLIPSTSCNFVIQQQAAICNVTTLCWVYVLNAIEQDCALYFRFVYIFIYEQSSDMSEYVCDYFSIGITAVFAAVDIYSVFLHRTKQDVTKILL